MSSLIQPLSSTVLHIRSKDAQQLTDGYNTNFQVQLTQAIVCQPDEETHIQLMSAELPYSFYNISDSLENNVFKFSQEGDTYTITIPNGSYDIDELVDAFNSNTDFSARLTMSFNEISLKITFTAVADDLLLLFHQSNINRELGFPVLYGDEEGEELSTAGDTLTAQV